MTMSASLTIVGNPIANQPMTCVLVVSNSGASAVNVTGIQPRLAARLRSSCYLGPVFVSPGQSGTNSGGINQMLVAVNAGGTATFTFDFVQLSGSIGTGQPSQATPEAFVTAAVMCDDGSYIEAVPQLVAPSQPQFGQPPASPPNAANSTNGALQFNRATNSALTF